MRDHAPDDEAVVEPAASESMKSVTAEPGVALPDTLTVFDVLHE